MSDWNTNRPAPITHLRSVSLAVPDLSGATAFVRHEWGLTPAGQEGDVHYLAAEGSPEAFALRLRQADHRRVDMVCFAAACAEDVDLLAERLGRSGVRLVSEPHHLPQVGGGYGFRFYTPDGHVLEVSSDVEQREAREIEERESIPRRISHVVLNSQDVPRMAKFFTDYLGFHVSDWLADSMCFLRCNTDHHSIAIHHGPHASLNHISWEMRGIDEFMRATGRLSRSGHHMIWGPGRHGPGDNTFSYFPEPNGFVLEFTTALECIAASDEREPRVWERGPEVADQWGTAGPPPEEAVIKLSGEQDPGLWTPPPV